MKRKLLVIATASMAMTIMAGLAYSYVNENKAALAMRHRRSLAAACKAMGLHPVFTYRRDGKSSIRLTRQEPASARALRLASTAPAALGDALTPLRAAGPIATVGITVKHTEKLIKLADKVNYGPATFETITGDTKIVDDSVDTNFTGDTRIEVTMNGFTYETTLDQGIKTDFDDPGKGFSKIQDMFWPAVDLKDNVFCTVKWSPGKIGVKTKMKLPRSGDPAEEFIANNTTTTYTDSVPAEEGGPNVNTNPMLIQDGKITASVAYGLAIDIENDSTDDMTWALPGGQVATGKKKTKVVKKKVAGELEYYVLTNFSASLKKAPLTGP